MVDFAFCELVLLDVVQILILLVAMQILNLETKITL
jgi:hypothetical protein